AGWTLCPHLGDGNRKIRNLLPSCRVRSRQGEALLAEPFAHRPILILLAVLDDELPYVLRQGFEPCPQLGRSLARFLRRQRGRGSVDDRFKVDECRARLRRALARARRMPTP